MWKIEVLCKYNLSLIEMIYFIILPTLFLQFFDWPFCMPFIKNLSYDNLAAPLEDRLQTRESHRNDEDIRAQFALSPFHVTACE